MELNLTFRDGFVGELFSVGMFRVRIRNGCLFVRQFFSAFVHVVV